MLSSLNLPFGDSNKLTITFMDGSTSDALQVLSEGHIKILEAAKKKYEESELKDAASKCRQAMESVSYNLWNKISNTSNGEISVAMRSPKSQPDLFSIVNALIKKTKKIQGMESITEKLEAIKEQDNWRVLNKGTHFEDEQSEFERADVKNVLDILTALDDSVRELKIQETAVV